MTQQHRHAGSRTRIRLIATPIAVFSLSVFALALMGCGEDEGGGQSGGAAGGQRGGGSGGGRGGSTAAIPVKTEAVSRAEMTSYIETNARLEAERWVEVVARTQGLVERLRAEEGNEVRQGAILLQLEKRELALQADQAEVTLEGARSTHERSKSLHERQLVSEEEFENTRQQLQNAEVNLQEARLQLEYADVRAPITGVVMLRNVEKGDLVRANDVVFAVADLDPLQARIRVPEKRMNQVRPGQEARVTVDPAPDRVFGATVRMISPGVDPASGTVKVTLDVPANKLLRPGMFATIRILTDRRPNVLVIPKKALVLETDEDDVFVVRQNKAERVRVSLGYVDGDRIEVLSGLTEGDLVVTVGHQGLKEDADVRIVGAQGADAQAVADEESSGGREEGRGGR